MPQEDPLDNLIRRHKAVLRDLFDGRLCSQTAAQNLATIAIPAPPPDQDDGDDDDDTMAHIEGMWNIMFGSLEDAPERTRIVCDLIVCMSQLQPALTQSVRQLSEGQPPQRVWEDTPRLGMSLHGEWSNIELPRQGAVIKRFTAVNELIGQLMLRDQEQYNYALFMLWTMRDALEYPLPYPGDQRQHTRSLCSIPAAVRLIEVAGQLISHWDYEFEQGRSKDPGLGGPLWNGKHGFCRQRWDLWRKRFFELSSEDWLDKENRDSAKKAADIMAKIT